MSTSKDTQRDVFISYASEHRETVARPLAELLVGFGLSVWFDEFDLTVGDGLRRKIDEGLANCRYGVVLFSKAFFGKHHTQRELDGLAQREVDGKKVILPVWIDVDEHEVRRYSPPLADRIAARWEEGPYSVARNLLRAINPDLLQRLDQDVKGATLSRVRTGKELAAILGGGHFGYYHHDDPNHGEELDLVSELLQEWRDWADIWDDMDVGGHVRTEFRFTEQIRELEGVGWTVFGVRKRGEREVRGSVGTWTWSVVAILRGEPERVMEDGDRILVFRKPATDRNDTPVDQSQE